VTGALSLRIEGRVQGVGYRAWLEGKAAAQGLRGWVRNRRDGSVEALLIGDPAVIMAVAEACRRGPRLATVTNLAATPAADDGSAGFRQLPTA
jgi:acylphosphatase